MPGCDHIRCTAKSVTSTSEGAPSRPRRRIRPATCAARWKVDTTASGGGSGVRRSSRLAISAVSGEGGGGLADTKNAW
ncbi:hypothetical protein GCM10023178_49370 [Actinomadura luteofluorescens]